MRTWYAECTLNQCVWGTLVMRFDSEAERNRWAERHHAVTRHRTVEYSREGDARGMTGRNDSDGI